MLRNRTAGELSSERGRTEYQTSSSSMNRDGRSVYAHEMVDLPLTSGPGDCSGSTSVQCQPDIRALRAGLERRLEIRQAKGHLRCSCGHVVEAFCRFLIDWDDDHTPISYCTGCAPEVLRALL